MRVNQGQVAGINAKVSIDGNALAAMRSGHGHRYQIECRDKRGHLKWVEYVENLVVNTGLDDILDKYYRGSAYTAAHYIGLLSGTPTVAAGDTMASHAGWTEVAAYTEAARQSFTPGSVSGQSVDNSASKAAYSINADSTTVGGIFLTTDSTKSGTTGTLVGAGAFTGGNKAVDNGDTLNVTATATAAAA